MSITTYAELKTAASNWLRRADLSAYLDDLATLGEKRIMRDVRATEMETAFSDTISSSGTLSAPSGFLGWKNVYIDASPAGKLFVMSIGQLMQQYPSRSSERMPRFIAYDAGSFQFGPFPDSTYTVKGTYYKRQGPLSSSVYDLFSNNPDLFLFAMLAEAEPFLKNDRRVALWEAKYATIRDAVNTEAKSIAGSGGLAITTA